MSLSKIKLTFKKLMRMTRDPLEHVEDDDRCWCNPDLYNICSEANDVGECHDDCWRCHGEGLVELYDEDEPIIIIHRDL